MATQATQHLIATVFRTWFGDRDYKKHMNLATVECAERAIGCLLDYIRREG